ncbi:hypothetical protein [Ligilactobacillus saerimneri]|nr:hypothetical protein [Ligilactobacillus saerimneri]
MKLYKPKKGDGIATLVGILMGVLIGGLLSVPLLTLGITSLDQILVPAFFIFGFISLVGGIFSKLL